MQPETTFAVVAALWAIAMLAVFIQAIRLSYRIERRSPQLQNTTGIPRKAMMFHTVLNLSVASDTETQAMRRRMLILLVINLLGFLALWAGIAWAYSGKS